MNFWTKEHALLLLPAFAIMIALSALIAHFLKDKDEKYKMIPIQIIAVILVVLEIIKQIYYIVRPEGYDFFAVPAHFCSLALFFLPIFAFYKGEYKKQIASFTFLCCSVITVFMFICPTLEFGASHIGNYTKSIRSFHTVTFHLLACFAFFLIVALKLYDYDTKRDVKLIPSWMGIFCIISSSVSQILQTNFNNFLACSMGFGETIRLSMISSIGWVGQVIYIVIIAALNIGFSYASYWIVRGAIALAKKVKLAVASKKTSNGGGYSEFLRIFQPLLNPRAADCISC